MAINTSLISAMGEYLSAKDYSGYVWQQAAQTVSDLIQRKTQQRLQERQAAADLFDKVDPQNMLWGAKNQYYIDSIEGLESEIARMFQYNEDGSKKNALQRGLLTNEQWLKISRKVAEVEAGVDERERGFSQYNEDRNNFSEDKHDRNFYESVINQVEQNGGIYPVGIQSALRAKAVDPTIAAKEFRAVPYGAPQQQADGYYINTTTQGLSEDDQRLAYDNVFTSNPAVLDGMLNRYARELNTSSEEQVRLMGVLTEAGVKNPSEEVIKFLEMGDHQYNEFVHPLINDYVKIKYKDELYPQLQPTLTERKLNQGLYNAAMNRAAQASQKEQEPKEPNFTVSDNTIVFSGSNRYVAMPSTSMTDENGNKLSGVSGQKEVEVDYYKDAFIYGRTKNDYGEEVTVRIPLKDSKPYIENKFPGFYEKASQTPMTKQKKGFTLPNFITKPFSKTPLGNDPLNLGL